MIEIRRAIFSDLPAVTTIEQASFADPWSQSMLRAHLMGRHGIFLVAQDAQGTIRGFALGQSIAGDSELYDIAVDPNMRGTGIGARLLDAMLQESRNTGAQAMTLEVRESNAAARGLYLSRGFKQVATRKRYYQSPVEDGLLMRISFESDPLAAVGAVK